MNGADDKEDNESFTELSTGTVNSENAERTVIYHQSVLEDNALCGKCCKGFYSKSCRCICCDKCEKWYHCSCVGIGKRQYEYFNDINNDDEWICQSCKSVSGIKPNKLTWGKFQSEEELNHVILSIQSEIIGWSKNLFLLPKGKAGRDFITELTRLINLFVNSTKWERFGLSLVHIFMPVMLQKPSAKSKARDHYRYLSQRLEKWKNGDLEVLMDEAREIQKRHQKAVSAKCNNKRKLFCQFMLLGKVAQATKLINQEDSVVGVHEITDEIIQILQDKHPKAAHNSDSDTTTRTDHANIQPVIFEQIDESVIQAAAKSTFGSGGPSQVDADGWKHILCSKFYGKESASLCQAIACVAKRLCTEDINPDHIKELLSCRLLPLNKNPGVRPIGVGEVLRRIIGKSVMQVLKQDILYASGTLQTCSGIDSGIEAAVHAMAEKFQEPSSEGLLLVDAQNAFNSLNRESALKTIQSICPTFYRYLHNTYQTPTRQYISGSENGNFIWSEEGATQGDNAAMAFYGLGTKPIINQLNETSSATQVWYADDSSSCGTLDELKLWWEVICKIGPEYGYNPNANKTVLIVKHLTDLPKAKMLFTPLGVTVTSAGQRHLGAVVGTDSFREEYVKQKVQCWVKDIEELAEIAIDEPQLVYASYTKGLSHRWTYVQRTIPNIEHLLSPLEDAISEILIPALIGRKVSSMEREILALPVRYGGLSLYDPSKTCSREYRCSKAITAPLVDLILKQDTSLENLNRGDVDKIKLELKVDKEVELSRQYNEICSKVSSKTKRALELSREKGASSWLTALPLKSMGYVLNKKEFRDSIHSRYEWNIPDIPKHCACGQNNSIDHALSCKKGGYIIMRHDALCKVEAKLMREAGCKDVRLEPDCLDCDPENFSPRTNTQPNARLDIAAVGVFRDFERTFFDVRVTHPNCPSNVFKPLPQLYKEHETAKKKEYEERILQSEKASFVPLVFTTSGGMGPACSQLNKQLAEMISIKRNEKYSDVMNHIRTRLRFAMLKTVLISLRGERGKPKRLNDDYDLENVSFNLIPNARSYEVP